MLVLLLYKIMTLLRRDYSFTMVGRNNSVSIAPRYGLDGSGIESRWGRDFPLPSRPALEHTQPPKQWAPALSRGLSGQILALTTHPI